MLAALEAACGSFDAAHDAITRRCGPVLGKRQLEESVVHAAADIPAFYAARIPQPCTSSVLLIMSADCKGIVMRPGALRAATAKAAAKLGKMRTRLSAGEKPNHRIPTGIGIVTSLAGHLAPGSAVAISHLTGEGTGPDRAQRSPPAV
jgi:hypothetical protein